jgi:hypothetical protein
MVRQGATPEREGVAMLALEPTMLELNAMWVALGDAVLCRVRATPKGGHLIPIRGRMPDVAGPRT